MASMMYGLMLCMSKINTEKRNHKSNKIEIYLYSHKIIIRREIEFCCCTVELCVLVEGNAILSNSN